MTNQIISDAEAEESINWLANNDYELAAAQAQYNRMNEGKKVVIAELSRASKAKSAKDREAEALACAEYSEYLDQLQEAEKHYLSLRYRVTAVTAKLDVWRTLQANQRKTHV